MLISTHQQLRRGLVCGLFENVKSAVAIGSKHDRLAVRSPGIGVIVSFVQRQAAGFAKPRSLRIEFGYVDIRLPSLFEEGQPLSIRGKARDSCESRLTGKAGWRSRWMRPRIQLHPPEIGIILIRRQFGQ